jgi:hypothetical protein
MIGAGFAKRLTLENLSEFAPLLKARSERGSIGGASATAPGAEDPMDETDSALAAVLKSFDGERFPVSLKFRRRRSGTERRTERVIPAAEMEPRPPAGPAPAARGPIVWRKVLAASDCQRQEGNPTGGIRLTQAKFKVNGTTIDQTTYFRHNLFRDFTWTRSGSKSEKTVVPFDLSIPARNTNFGVLDMEVTHKPSGESGQGNYTSLLKWTGITTQIRGMDLVGTRLVMYGPKPGTTQPFFIEIT